MAAVNVCGLPLKSKDRKVWQQAIAMLMGLKIRNGFGEDDLAAAVGKALRTRGTSKRYCEDCAVKVAHGAASSGRAAGRGWSHWAGDH